MSVAGLRSSRSCRGDVKQILRTARHGLMVFDASVASGAVFNASQMRALCGVLTAVVVMWLILVSRSYALFHVNHEIDYFSFAGVANDTPLAFPSAFAASWATNPHLVALGIPMGNDAKSLALRAYHKHTWASFEQVARRDNAFHGLLLPLYVAGAAQQWSPYWDPVVKNASDSDGNILIFRLVERSSSTGKSLGNRKGRGAGYGLPAMITNARKISLWFRYAYSHFRHTPFLAKADLDVYVNVPAYLTVVQQLPRVSTLFGKSRPFLQLFCDGDHIFLYLLGQLYTHTRDVAREVFTEPHLMHYLSQPYNRCHRSQYDTFGFKNEDTVHSHMLYVRYASGTVARPFPTQEWQDAHEGASLLLPAVAGLGKVYMDRVANTTPVLSQPLTGHVAGLRGYSYDYKLPGPINRTHLVFVTDNCRNGDEPVVRPDHYGLFSHRASSRDTFEDHHKKYNTSENTFDKMAHPSLLEVKEADHFYYRVDLSNAHCEYAIGNPTHTNVDWRECWHGRMPDP